MRAMTASERVRKVVFPAGGLGTRILPATAVLPKELLPIVDKPLIQYGVEEAAESGLSRVILVNNPTKTILEEHFTSHSELQEVLERRGKAALLASLRDLALRIELSTVYQNEPHGLGHAVLLSRDLVGEEPFAVVLSDDVIDADPPALRQMLTVFDEVNGPVLLVERVPREAVQRYGVIDGKHDYEMAIYMFSNGATNLEDIVTHKFDLNSIQQGFQCAYDKTTASIKVQIHQE